MSLNLYPRQSGGGQVTEIQPNLWRMEIPPGPSGRYRWAQLDDYMHFPRAQFPWHAPVQLELRARVSGADLPGTWGFGFWNDPFSTSLGVSGSVRRLPVMPNAAWFFFAGQPNYLAFRDTHPATGFLAATFSSPDVFSLALAPAALALPLLAVPFAARLLRRFASRLINEDSVLVQVNPTVWHSYRVEWLADCARFFVDQVEVLATPISPRGKLGLVLWIDNQYASFPPSGQLRAGTSLNPDQIWLEIDQIHCLDGTG